MDQIRQAVERAKKSRPVTPQDGVLTGPYSGRSGPTGMPLGQEVALNAHRLESNRIIAHDITDPRARSFDMLRTQVLQPMDMKSWHLLGITSPTAGCGKTVVSINLALSIARQPDRSVLLVDFDLQKPKIANYLGLKGDRGLLGVLEGRTSLTDAIVKTRIRNEELLVLPCETATLRSSEWMASRSMVSVLQDIRRNFQGWTVILDFPPILASDDFITILPQIDCILFVTGVGTTTKSEIKECNKHLDNASIVRVVVNKSLDSSASYYYSRYATHLSPNIAAE